MGKNKKKKNADDAQEALISDKKAGELIEMNSSDVKDIEETNSKKHSLEKSKVSSFKKAESENGSVKGKLVDEQQKDVKSNHNGSAYSGLYQNLDDQKMLQKIDADIQQKSGKKMLEPEGSQEVGIEAPTKLKDQFILVAKLSVGPIVSMFFYMFVQLINTYFIGHSNDSTLIAGVGMGNMLINVLAFAIMQGLNGAIETLNSQAYGASQNMNQTLEYRRKMRQQCGYIYSRGRFVCTMVMIPMIIIFCLSDKILIGIHMDVDVSKTAKLYVTLMIPGVWAMGQFDSSKKFLSSQCKNTIPVVVQLITTILHFGLCWVFIYWLDMRERGAAAATNITYILNMLMTDFWIRYKKDVDFPDMIFWYNTKCTQELGSFLQIGIPGMLMLCFEWWAFEFLAIFAGLLSVNDLAAEVVIINMITFIFMLPLGISYSASALTGNFLGEGKIDLAKRFASLTILLDIILTTVVVILMGLFSKGLSELFTKESSVVKIVRENIWVLLLYIWFDTIHGVQSGIIRGLGLQSYGSIYTLICYYLIGMPLALILAFNAQLGITGLWLGFSIACIILDAGFALIISCPNWHQIHLKMKKKLEAGQISRTPEVNSLRMRMTPRASDNSQKRNMKLNQHTDRVPAFGVGDGVKNASKQMKISKKQVDEDEECLNRPQIN